MQVPSTTQPPPDRSSASQPKAPLPPEPSPGHSSNAYSSSTHSCGQHQQQKKPSEDKDKDLNGANCTHEQFSNLTQSTATPEAITSTNGPPKLPSDVPTVPVLSIHSQDDGNSEANKGGQGKTTESDKEIPPTKLPKNEEDTKQVSEYCWSPS